MHVYTKQNSVTGDYTENKPGDDYAQIKSAVNDIIRILKEMCLRTPFEARGTQFDPH